MALTDAALNVMGDALGDVALYVSLHSSDPGTSGTNETSASRKAATWSTASGGDLSLASALDFTGGTSGGDCKYAGLWSAATSGTFYGGFAITGDQSFNSAGEYTLDDLTISGS